MAGSLNKVMLIGHLGRDPEIRSTQDGTRIANLSLATSESWRDKQTGDRREKTEWHRISIFNDKLVDVVEKYVKKGAKLYLEGQLQTRKWTDKDGHERYTTEVVLGRFNGTLTMLDTKNGGSSGGSYDQGDAAEPAPAPRTPSGSGNLSRDLDDEIPF